MDNENTSRLFFASYQITMQQEFYFNLQKNIATITGSECHFFDEMIRFLSSVKRPLLQIERICRIYNVDANWNCICHGRNT